jgi:lipopolysaccharide/colanic/teichoic acid biosynthesis glycosyltransferase
MIALDVRYAAELSFWLDVKILAKTIPTVLFGRGAC